MFKESFVQKALELLVRRAAAHAGVGLWEIVGPVTKGLALFRGIVSSGSAFIFTELHIQGPMTLVFNGPMAAFRFQKLACRHAAAAVDEIVCLL